MAAPANGATTLGTQRIIGTPSFVATGLTLKSTNRRKNPVDGESRVYVYSGTQAAVLRAYQTINLTDYLEVEIDESSAPEYRLTVTAPDDSTVTAVTNYELLTNILQNDIFGSDRALTLSDDVIKDIRKRVDNREGSTGLTGDAAKLYQAVAKFGATSFSEYHFLYRVTKVVARNYTEKVAMSNIQKIYKTSQVISETQPPPGLVFSLSDVKADSSAGGPADIPETGTDNGWILGWRKSSVEIRRVAGYRLAITTEFEAARWLSFTYKAA